MSATATNQTPADHIVSFAMANGIAMVTDFVPFSQSRNRKEKNPSLNWKVTLSKNGREILSTDYMAGSGHAPSSISPVKAGSHLQHEAIKWECEHGRPARLLPGNSFMLATGKALQPKIEDVLYSLAMEADVLEYSSFEDWASNFGYETDSRKAEAIYRACLYIALKLRAALGDDGLAKLREACQDY